MKLKVFAATGLMAFASMTALAGPNEVNFGMVSAGAACDVTTFTPDADDCRGVFAGNNLGSADPGAVNSVGYINAVWGGSGVTFTEGVTNNSPTAGSFSLSGLTGDIVLAFKQAQGFSFFLFEDVSAANPITWTSNFGFGGNGNDGDVSHITVYGSTAPIPEPETYALMLAGLGAVGFMARRRKAAAAGLKPA